MQLESVARIEALLRRVSDLADQVAATRGVGREQRRQFADIAKAAGVLSSRVRAASTKTC